MFFSLFLYAEKCNLNQQQKDGLLAYMECGSPPKSIFRNLKFIKNVN